MEGKATGDCKFCQRMSVGKMIFENPLVVAFRCAHPASPGHTLIVPRRHVENLLELDGRELEAMWEMTREVCDWLQEEKQPDGFNVGANIGVSAGQTVAHCNFHVIPRYKGDVDDPRGGIRAVKPDTAAYWENRNL